MLDYTIDNRGDVGAWWVELILLRVVALRNVLLLVKKINKLKSAALLIWSKMLVESVATFTLVTGKNSVVFIPALDPR